MSYQEKRNIVSILSTLLVSVIYFTYIYQTYSDKIYNPAGDFSFWGAAFLILIPVLAAAKIIIHIIFNIINKIATDEDEPSITDELDKLIELKAARNTHYFFMAGVLLSVGSLVLGNPPSFMFLSIIFSMISACIINDISQLYYYRKGV